MNLSIRTINVHELKNLLEQENNACYIDVREVEEWNELRIPNIKNIPKDVISCNIQQYIDDKSQAIYLICKAGVRSIYAAQLLLQCGFCNVYSVEGGIIDWVKAGYPTESMRIL